MLTIINKGSWLTIINKGLSLMIVNKMTNFIKNSRCWKAIVFEKKLHALLLNVFLHEVKKLWGS